jgi:hypothetical protein
VTDSSAYSGLAAASPGRSAVRLHLYGQFRKKRQSAVAWAPNTWCEGLTPGRGAFWPAEAVTGWELASDGRHVPGIGGRMGVSMTAPVDLKPGARRSFGRPHRGTIGGHRHQVMAVALAGLPGGILGPGAPHGAASIGAITEYTIPTPNSGSGSVTRGPDGALWFTECFGHKVGRVTPFPGVASATP